MQSFIEEVITDLQKKEVDFSRSTFVLPSKRSGLFLKNQLSKTLNKTIFAPEILSIEEFIENISGLNYAGNTELIFEFYHVYLRITPKEQIEPFDSFSKWATILLQDFNELDRYMVPPDSIFGYIKAIKELNHWSKTNEQTEHISNYLSFWSRIKDFYHEFRNHLFEKRKGYQGMVYREAVENLEHYISSLSGNNLIFLGFNALNSAEELILQELLVQNLASVYWDTDDAFFNNQLHGAGLFMRSHKTRWPYFKNHEFNWIKSNYSSDKSIDIIGVPKNIGQIKYIGEILATLTEEQKSLQKTAVVLGDETLLLPLLNSLPQSIDAVNITMGLPLKSIPLASLFDVLFLVQKKNSNSYFYKDVISILSHPFIKPLFQDGDINHSDQLIALIQNSNLSFLSVEKLKSFIKFKPEIIETIFESWQNNPDFAIKQCSKLIFRIKETIQTKTKENLLDLEYLYRFNQLFNELKLLNSNYKHINSISALLGVYRELLKTATLDFKGEPLKGLQIMGMLESRVLDFETVIISSVNEDILPAGKTGNSFIPFDVKIENGLPTYKEKDAVYTYHFYRLLQRAKTIFILYNTEPDVLNGGEKSRFITQMELEGLHPISHYIVSPKVPVLNPIIKTVKKTESVMSELKDLALNGFSPSALTNYIRNPIDFYYDKILGLKDYEDVEETVAANTLGNVIHETLESFYNPLVNTFLTETHIATMKKSIDATVSHHFRKHFKEGDITKGKNLIVFEIAKRYISNFLDKELEMISAGDRIKIIGIEKKLIAKVSLPELNFPVHIKGTVDRIDECNGMLRIIDYKTGKVSQNQVEIVDWNDLTTDYEKYSKSFQVLAYAYMLNQNEPFASPIEGGIISFKNLQNNVFLKFGKKDRNGNGAIKNQLISQETLHEFEIQLKNLILEICNPAIDFVEKEVDY